MKKTNRIITKLLITLLFVYPIKLICQKTYKIIYQKTLKQKNKVIENECILYFDNNQSYFLTKLEKAITQPYQDEEGSVITPSNTIDSIANKPRFVYYNKNNNQFNLNNINYNEEVLIQLEQNNEKWEISNETKKIKNFLCYKALKKINDIKYIAWFTKLIPYKYGPISLNGLDGLILELYTEDDTLHYSFIKKETTKEIISNFIKKYDFSKSISYDEYLELKKKRKEEFKERVYNSLPKGSKIIENTKKCDDCK